MKTHAKRSTVRKGGTAFQQKGNQSDIYEMFTNLIIEKLEQGVIPWKQSWHDMGSGSNNHAGKKPVSIQRSLFWSALS